MSSVCRSVTVRYRADIGWNSSKIICPEIEIESSRPRVDVRFWLRVETGSLIGRDRDIFRDPLYFDRATYFNYYCCSIVTARCYAERGYEIACRLSIRTKRLGIVITYIGWNSFKMISRPNSLRHTRSLTPSVGDLVQREHPQKLGWNGEWGQEHIQESCAIAKTTARCAL